MKKVLTFAILIFASVLTFACKDGAKAQPNEPEQKEAKSGEVIVMNKDMFIKDVFDYEKSQDWKYKGDKPAIIDLYADWCGPCKMMSSKVFPDKQAGDFFNPRFISLKIDMEKDEGKELAQKWNIRVFPTYLILDPQGEIVYTSQGYIPAEELIRRMNEGLEQWKNNIKTGK